ncbi:hypothetical protein ACFLZX_05655, partial [Nanoarchaeota archaeon]
MSLKKLVILPIALLVLLHSVLAIGVGIGVIGNVTPTNSPPMICMDPDSRLFDAGGPLAVPRVNNYAFEGESIEWDVLVREPDGIIDIREVGVTVGPTQGVGQPIEVNCFVAPVQPAGVIGWCNDGTGSVTYNAATDVLYTCILAVETSNSMHGQYWVQAEVTDQSGQQDAMDEAEYWFF